MSYPEPALSEAEGAVRRAKLDALLTTSAGPSIFSTPTL